MSNPGTQPASRRHLATLLAFLLSTFSALHVSSAQRIADAKIEAAVQMKVQGYDKDLKKRSKEKLVIAVVYMAGGNSQKVAQEVVGGFLKMAKELKVQGMTVTVVPLQYDAATFASDAQKVGATLIYIAPGLEGEIGRIHGVAAALKAGTLCGDRGMVKSGVAVGVFEKSGKPGIAINLKVAKELGVNFDSQLFQVAEVFK